MATTAAREYELTLSLTAHLMLLISLQSYKLAPPKKKTLCKLKTILMMSWGPICNLLNPLSSCFLLSDMWANGRSSLVQGQHQPIQCQLNSRCGGEGVGAQGWRASLCCNREKCKNRQSTLNHIAFWP
jgi:hypothetical protein